MTHHTHLLQNTKTGFFFNLVGGMHNVENLAYYLETCFPGQTVRTLALAALSEARLVLIY